MTAATFSNDNPALNVFTCKKYKSFYDSNDHLNTDFDLYFKGKKAATYHLDPWSSESEISFVSDDMKQDVVDYASQNGLFDAARERYIKDILSYLPESERESSLKGRTFTIDDVVTELSYVFHEAQEQKKFDAKVKRLTKNSIVVGNKEAYIPLTFKVKALEDLARYKNGQEALKNAHTRAKELLKENKGFTILNSEEQLKSLGLIE